MRVSFPETNTGTQTIFRADLIQFQSQFKISSFQTHFLPSFPRELEVFSTCLGSENSLAEKSIRFDKESIILGEELGTKSFLHDFLAGNVTCDQSTERSGLTHDVAKATDSVTSRSVAMVKVGQEMIVISGIVSVWQCTVVPA